MLNRVSNDDAMSFLMKLSCLNLYIDSFERQKDTEKIYF